MSGQTRPACFLPLIPWLSCPVVGSAPWAKSRRRIARSPGPGDLLQGASASLPLNIHRARPANLPPTALGGGGRLSLVMRPEVVEAMAPRRRKQFVPLPRICRHFFFFFFGRVAADRRD